MPTTEVLKPHDGPQTLALIQPENTFEILYGGARGGGKTFAGLLWLLDHIDKPKYRALVIRRNADDLTDWIDRARQLYIKYGATVTGRPGIIKFPSGAVIRTGHLKDEAAYTKYQGHEYQRIVIEELTQITLEKMYLQLIASCRSTVPGIKPRIFLTANPGGNGHSWVKARFVDPERPNKRFEDNSGRKRIYIPARVDDNPTLLENDPDYLATLESLKEVDLELYKAWRMGSWEVFAGQAFRQFNYDTHVSPFLDYPLDLCKKIITFDWGFRDPVAIHWIALTPENHKGVRRAFVYREIHYGEHGKIPAEKEPEELAKEIKKFTDTEKVDYMVLPHDAFAHKESKFTIADIFKRVLNEGKGTVNIKRGNTLQRGARLNRVAIMHQYLAIAADGKPYIQFHPSCKSIIKSLPTLIYDEKHVEDIDTTGDDHDYDSVTLGLITLGYRPSPGIVKGEFRLPQEFPTWQQDKYGNIPAPDFWTEFTKPQPIKDPEFPEE